jgi:hypothetical protein
MMASDAEMPGWLQTTKDYLDGLCDILDLHADDCVQTTQALRKHHQTYKSDMGMVDQMAMVQQVARANKQEQQKLGAMMALVLFKSFERLLPLIEDFSNECPKESAVFYEVLR